MNYKYCGNCGKENLLERKVCFFCEGDGFVSSPGALSEIGTKKKVLPKSNQKIEESQNETKSNPEKNTQLPTGNAFSLSQIEELVKAQNRTTHAVRAFVRFLFIQLSGTTMAIFLWNLSQTFIDQQECLRYGTKCSPNAFFQVLAILIWIISVIWSSYQGWDELHKSDIR